MTPGVKSYAGHVYLPPGTADLGQGQDYPINSVSRVIDLNKGNLSD